MDASGWLILGSAAVAALVLAALGPWLMRDHRRRQSAGGGGGSLSGVGGGFDAVWRPSAEQARADWEAQIEVPAPAPDPAEPGRIAGGRIVLRLEADPGSDTS